MNKKTYLAPMVCTTLMQTGALLNIGSGVNSKDPDIPYGGVDDGTNKPGSRLHYNIWEDEEGDQPEGTY